MTRGKKDQDGLLFKKGLGREEVAVSLIYSILRQLEIHMESPFSKSYVTAKS